MYNPFENVCNVIKNSATKLGLKENDFSFLLKPENEYQVEMNVKMDDGTIKKFEGYRIQHSTILGPAKGGIRFHQNVNYDEVKALSTWMSLKCAVADLPYGGGKGGVTVNPKELSINELEALSRAYENAIDDFIGPYKDVPAPDVNTNSQIMDWMTEERIKRHGQKDLATFTGKTVGKGGSLGRTGATSRGVVAVAEKMISEDGKTLKDMRVAVQGLGNVGGLTALILQERGANIVALACDQGSIYGEHLDAKKVINHIKAGGHIKDLGYEYVDLANSNPKFFAVDAELIIPAALENQITKEIAPLIKAKYICEGANGPTTIEADQILLEKGITVAPDILANSGGVTVSYFEWVQNLENNYWSEEEVNDKLDKVMAKSYSNVKSVALKYHVSMREGAYMYAINKIVNAKNKK